MQLPLSLPVVSVHPFPTRSLSLLVRASDTLMSMRSPNQPYCAPQTKYNRQLCYSNHHRNPNQQYLPLLSYGVAMLEPLKMQAETPWALFFRRLKYVLGWEWRQGQPFQGDKE